MFHENNENYSTIPNYLLLILLLATLSNCIHCKQESSHVVQARKSLIFIIWHNSIVYNLKMSKKRKCSVSDSMLKEFPFLRRSVKESAVFCSLCQNTFTIASGGKTSVVEHIGTKRHRSALSCESGNSKVSQFFKNTVPVKRDLIIAIEEGTFAFHTVKHYQSFKSMDCTAGLIRKFNEPKFTCARTKVEAIVKFVLAPWAFDRVKEEISVASFVTILFDASNHGSLKTLPILIRYVNIDREKTINIQTKLIDFVEITGETADILSHASLEIVKRFGIENKIVGISGDNTNTNFGGLKRKGKNNVFTKVREQLERKILGLGCIAHMIHNCAHLAINSIPIDVEGIVVKVFGYFHIFTVRVERLKECCAFVGQEYKKILSYNNVRWLSLLPAVRRICEIYPSLESFFLSEEKCPVMFKKWFSDPCTLLWMNFANATLPLFHDVIMKTEGEDVSAIESSILLSSFIEKLNCRKEEKFIPSSVKQLLASLEENGSYSTTEFLKVSCEFYENAVEYINAWVVPSQDTKAMECILLRSPPERKQFEEMAHYFSLNVDGLNLNDDNLFDEISFLKQYVTSEKIEKWNAENATLCSKWSDILKFFSEKMMPYQEVQKLIELSLCLPGSNASVERVFSSMNMMWTSQKSNMSVGTARAMLAILTNFNMTCQEFATKLESREDLLMKIHASEKYM